MDVPGAGNRRYFAFPRQRSSSIKHSFTSAISTCGILADDSDLVELCDDHHHHQDGPCGFEWVDGFRKQIHHRILQPIVTMSSPVERDCTKVEIQVYFDQVERISRGSRAKNGL